MAIFTGIVAISFSAFAQPQLLDNNLYLMGTIQDPEVTESSGIVASRRFPGVFWTHNDDGGQPVLHAIGKKGQALGRVAVAGITVKDWEDIAADENGNLYIADIGDNGGNRKTLAIYKLREPNPNRTSPINVTGAWSLKFPGNPEDCEAFFVANGSGYVIGKQRVDGKVTIYGFPMSSSSTPVKMQRVAKIKVTAPVTGADISKDKRRLGIITEQGAYVFHIDGNVGSAGSAARFFMRFDDTTMEGGCFAGSGFLVSAEDGNLYLFTSPAFQGR